MNQPRSRLATLACTALAGLISLPTAAQYTTPTTPGVDGSSPDTSAYIARPALSDELVQCDVAGQVDVKLKTLTIPWILLSYPYSEELRKHGR